MISYKNVINYKIVDLFVHYNFDIKISSPDFWLEVVLAFFFNT